MPASPQPQILGEYRAETLGSGGLEAKETSTSAASPELCSRCASLDIRKVLERHQDAAFDEEIIIWEWDDYNHRDWLKEECSFCQLVSVIKIPHDKSQANHWYFTPPDFLYVLDSTHSGRPTPLGLRKVVSRLSQDGSAPIWRDPSGRTRRNWTLFLASRSTVQSQGDVTIRRIDADTIDFDIVKHWLSTDKLHQKRRATSHSFPDRLIDSTLMKVVPATGQPYIALSYVWGEALHSYPDVYKGILPDKIPATVRDALSATRALGYRFLWVDKFCIDQSDEAARLLQIHNMDIIFKCAQVTLVAASGQDGEFGLPGVSNRARQRQPSVCLNGISFVITPSTKVVQEQIQLSKWNTRAWTFQEAHLSPRLLVFTETELYFSSPSMAIVARQ